MSSRDKKRKETPEERSRRRTILYDCSISLRLEVPRDEYSVNPFWPYRITLMTIAHEFVSRHPEYDKMADEIYKILKKTVSAQKRNFNIVKKDKTRLALTKDKHESGQFLEESPPKGAGPVYDEIEYSGVVDENFQRSGPVHLECSVKLFLSPGVYGAAGDYSWHGFDELMDKFKDKPDWDSVISMMDWVENIEENPVINNLGDRWRWFCPGFIEKEEHREYKEGRIQYFMEEMKKNGELW